MGLSGTIEAPLSNLAPLWLRCIVGGEAHREKKLDCGPGLVEHFS